jgi:uncharacterized repeat protein (TIGR01451 family)
MQTQEVSVFNRPVDLLQSLSAEAFRRSKRGIARGPGLTLLAVTLSVAGLLAVAVFGGPGAVTAVAASPDLSISTPYPSVIVAPGTKASFGLTVQTAQPTRVNLAVTDIPKGWTATVRGGGFEVAGVTSQASPAPALTLDVSVPQDAAPGLYHLTVTATAGTLSDTLPIEIRVAQEASGSVSLDASFPSLSGPSGTTFTFNLTLRNDTPRSQMFAISAQGPENWEITARPSSQSQATSITVDAGSQGAIEVTAKPPDGVAAGSYDIVVKAASADTSVETKLGVEITGTYRISLTTPGQLLNVHGTVGSPITQQFQVTNSGTAPLRNVQLNATPPSGWTVKFDPATIAEIQPGQQVAVAATITPSNDAVAGDYAVSFQASTQQANASLDLRVTVEASTLWLVVGGGLIVLTVLGLGFVFQRYGRR